MERPIHKNIEKMFAENAVYKINNDANYYRNTHYHFIERILNETLPWIAQANGLRMGRTQITSLESDYNEQESDLILNILNSFEEE